MRQPAYLPLALERKSIHFVKDRAGPTHLLNEKSFGAAGCDPSVLECCLQASVHESGKLASHGCPTETGYPIADCLVKYHKAPEQSEMRFSGLCCQPGTAQSAAKSSWHVG